MPDTTTNSASALAAAQAQYGSTFTWTGGTLNAATITVGAFGNLSVGQNWTYAGYLNLSPTVLSVGYPSITGYHQHCAARESHALT